MQIHQQNGYKMSENFLMVKISGWIVNFKSQSNTVDIATWEIKKINSSCVYTDLNGGGSVASVSVPGRGLLTKHYSYVITESAATVTAIINKKLGTGIIIVDTKNHKVTI